MNPVEKTHATVGAARSAAALMATELGDGWTPSSWVGVGESSHRRRFVKAWFAKAEQGGLGVYQRHGFGYFGRRRGGVSGPVVATPREAAQTAPAPSPIVEPLGDGL